jgi:hypothetical protein
MTTDQATFEITISRWYFVRYYLRHAGAFLKAAILAAVRGVK